MSELNCKRNLDFFFLSLDGAPGKSGGVSVNFQGHDCPGLLFSYPSEDKSIDPPGLEAHWRWQSKDPL